MKKYIFFTLATVLAMSMAFASGPDFSKRAQPLNLKEVVNSIEYPKISNQNGIEGMVLMYVKIDETGKIVDKQALSFPCHKLKDAVETAIEDLEFTPAKNSLGESVASELRIPFEFVLELD